MIRLPAQAATQSYADELLAGIETLKASGASAPPTWTSSRPRPSWSRTG
ncbi:MAG: hypothetical protein JO287_03625 [Pseudonocardiales bacterium]|nr:hypothetical protein [Pseudonocardiales bacterium]